MRERHHARRHRRRGSAAGSAGGPSRVPRVAGRAEQHRLAGRRHPELRRIGLAQDDQARPAQPEHELGVEGGHVAGQEAGTLGEAHALHLAGQVLDQVRHPGEGPCGSGPRLLGRPLEDRRDHGVQHRVQRLDPLDGRRDQLGRADLAGADQFGLGGRVEQREVLGHGRTVCRTCATWTSPRPLIRGAGSPASAIGFEERVARGEFLVDFLGRAGVEHRQPGVGDDAEVHVEGVDSEPLQQPLIRRQELAGVTVEVRRAEIHRSAHGQASSTMLNGADSAATRRTRV